eukprot:CAMPEP_0115433806 /NCGR_PEP_ID=MMETSP0271-20121206/32818_1 /TAXON_ID=71861 /ORGANISM="Scrippsiella trochoidea, Strain CCMP3099" /LENGTH=238 /DNA_ID=CAMNT_0002859213 /DNA_START=123 /DNA_END=839 /DNA_ORIENTATION=+
MSAELKREREFNQEQVFKKFNADGNTHRTHNYDALMAGKAEYKGQLNFSAYRQGTDPQFLGVNGKNYYAKPWGNDSSNMQAIINGPAYQKRIFYRENIAARFHREDKQAAIAKADEEKRNPTMRKTQSESALEKIPDEEPKDAYQGIKDSMRPFVERQGKPRIRAMEHGERLHFFNTLGNKYHMKAGGKNLTWNVSTQTHRSTPNELRWILSNYFRTDTQAVLAGAGSEPNLQASKGS